MATKGKRCEMKNGRRGKGGGGAVRCEVMRAKGLCGCEQKSDEMIKDKREIRECKCVQRA